LTNAPSLAAEEWVQSKQSDPAFQSLFLYIRKITSRIKSDWAAGMYTGPSADQTAQLNAQAIGQIQALENLLNLSYEDLVEVINEE